MLKPKRSDIALDFIRRTFEGQSIGSQQTPVSTANAAGDDLDIAGTLRAVSGNGAQDAVVVSPRNPVPAPAQHPHKELAFGFTEEGWNRLQEIGVNIGTTQPSQIVRRALAVLWLVALGHCSLKDNVTGKTVHIPE